jgi:glucose 1-dehydrogenase
VSSDESVNLFSLAGKKAFVTGSSRGIGYAIAETFVDYGAECVVHASKPSTRFKAATERLANKGKVHAVSGDLSSSAEIHSLARFAKDAIGELDILVLNAAVQTRKRFHDVERSDVEYQLMTNIGSTVELIQAFLPPMKAHGWGRVLYIGSLQEFRPHPAFPIYAASKAAISNLVRNLAMEYSRWGITINTLAPGVIRTDRNEDALADGEYRKRISSQIPSGVLGVPADCVGLALTLCSDAGRYITGCCIPVDGGMSLPYEQSMYDT